MAQAKRIVVAVPEDLLASVDGLLAEGGNRSAFVREAIRLLVSQRRRIKANLERLQRGYEFMGRLNVKMAEEGLSDDLGTLEAYERTLGERENG